MSTAALVAGYQQRTRRGGFQSARAGAGAGLGLVASFDADLARVYLVVTGFSYDTTRIEIDRYDRAVLTNPTAVRGGYVSAVSGDVIRLYDYEFTAGATNTYRVRAYAGDLLVATAWASVSTPISTVWLKSVARPFLNRTVTVVDFSSVTTPARGGVFEVLGRRLPVAVTEVRGSKRYELVIRAADADEVAAVRLFLSFGDVVLLQPPDGCQVPGALYAAVGDVVEERRGKHDTAVRYFTLPLTEVAAPSSLIVGYTVTWAGVVSGFATWADVKAAFGTWLEVQEYISDATDETVG